MSTTSASRTSPSRAPTSQPKIRSSCDACQAAKIKCGQERPSCQRCCTQGTECVYGISRRMGRPKSKNTRAPPKKDTVPPPRKTSPLHPLPDAASDFHDFDFSTTTPMGTQPSGTTHFATLGPAPDSGPQDYPPATNLQQQDAPCPFPHTPNSDAGPAQPPLTAELDWHPDMALALDDSTTVRGFSPTMDLFGAGPASMDAFSHAQDFDPIISLLAHSNNANASSPNDSGCAGLPSPGPPDCSCYSTILGSILASRLEERATTVASADAMLKTARDAQNMLSKILTCSSCMQDQFALLLGLTSLSKTVYLLDRTASLELRPDRRHPTSGRISEPQFKRMRSRSSWPRPFVSDCSLRVGFFEVVPDGRSDFLRNVLHLRFHNLAQSLEDLQSRLGQVADSPVSKAGLILARDVAERLQAAQGKMELWE
ncbi:hypothetical protein BFW01_g2803 [Lasiodiplodia theobromae]|nr:hypothetical protein BFW01_g2803 [Lasiodiplodia theobromae]